MSSSTSFVVLAAILALTGAANANVIPIYSNLSSDTAGADQLTTGLADSFSTKNSHFAVSFVALSLSATDPEDGGSFTIELLRDNGKRPGMVLETIATVEDWALAKGTNAFLFSFTPWVLAPHQRYWIGVVANAPTSMHWSWSLDQTALGVAGEYFASDGFDNVFPNTDGPYQLQIQGTNVPEPATVALFLAGLMGMAWGVRRRFGANA